MKNSKLFFAAVISLLLFFAPVVIFSQSTGHTLEDYGLSAESVKYLTPEEIQDILSSKTPEETIAERKAQINETGTPEQKETLKNSQLANLGYLDNTVNCFDYYKFGSVQTTLTAQGFYFNTGDTINLSGPITNQNDYPIVSGTLYVKIFRVINTEKNANGPDVVDQFIAADNIVIPAKGETPVSFSWKIPASLNSGNYRIASFFTVDKKFNLLGLSFTDDVVGNTFNFRIEGEKSIVKFDKTGVTINDNSYFFASYPPRISINDSAVVLAKIDNTTNSDEKVDIVWKLYKWDAMNPDNFVRTVSEEVTIEANSSENIKITIPEAVEPVYYLIGELSYKDSKSIINVRFVRPEVDKIRLNFPSITSFPIKSGATSTMFSCLHNSGQSQLVSNGKLTLKITDVNGKTVNEYTYNGQVTGEMMAVKNDFKSRNTLDHFFLTAQLWQADKLVDQSTMEYDCNKIDSKLCKQNNSFLIFLVIGIIILILVVAVVAIFIKKKK